MAIVEPTTKEATVFIDGQNLYHAAKEAFGYTFPNYDVMKLATAICRTQNWTLRGVRFYTGVPDSSDNAFWQGFWESKLSVMGRQGVTIFTRPLRYRNKTVALPDGTQLSFLAGEEKGIDVRIALDVIRLCREAVCDVALILSQDQDLSEVAAEVRLIAKEQQRWVKVASAFPFSPTIRNKRGIEKTDWIRIDRAMYDGCLDTRDYRRRPGSGSAGATP